MYFLFLSIIWISFNSPEIGSLISAQWRGRNPKIGAN